MRLPATIGLIFLLVLFWLIGAVFTPTEETAGILSISVADAILAHIRPWVYVTAGFYHPHLMQLIVVLPVTFGLAKRVEPEIGTLNFVRMLVFANTMASFVMFVELFSLYIIIREPIYLTVSLSGFTGGITALLVAFMKLAPHATTSFLPGIKLRYYPLLASIIFFICTLGGIASSMTPIRVALIGAGPFSVLGGYFGWYYLRFLNKNDDQTLGDTSEDFALVMLLPDFCTPIVGPVANFCFNVVKLCGYFKNRDSKASSALPVLAETASDPIAERRKARAMKALDEKLAKLANARETPRSSLGSHEVQDNE